MFVSTAAKHTTPNGVKQAGHIIVEVGNEQVQLITSSYTLENPTHCLNHALGFLTKAIEKGRAGSVLFANRAKILLDLKRPKAAL